MKKADKIRVLKLAIKLSIERECETYGMCQVINWAEERLGFNLGAGMPYRSLRNYGITKGKYLRKNIATKRGAFWYAIGGHWNVRRAHLRAALKDLMK